jgi:hypothetical protein
VKNSTTTANEGKPMEGIISMWIEKGEKVKSKLNGQLYVVEEIDAR